MPQIPSPTVQNHFQAGLKTEFTGLNFPENAATDTQNCVFSIVGDVSRRGGIDFETNFGLNLIDVPGVAKSSFRWLNAGGDGQSQILVEQVGTDLYFYLTSSATVNSPVSRQILANSVDLGQFVILGTTGNPGFLECQYSTGNGYLFVYHPNCDPFYCTYNFPSITATRITLQTRDLVGILEPNVPDNFRPSTLSNEHLYNLLNQGWTTGPGWTASSTFGPTQGIPLSVDNPSGSMSLQLFGQSATNVVTVGDELKLVLSQCAGTGTGPHNNGVVTLTGTVTSYNGGSGAINLIINSNNNPQFNSTGQWQGGNFAFTSSPVSLTLVNEGFITTWFSVLSNYPSNADIWWLYKDTSEAFNPSATFSNVQSGVTTAPKGVYLFNPFNQDRSAASGVGGLTPVTTAQRPSTGAFFQGRVFYAGINASQLAQGDEPYTTWTENIYFSQIIQEPADFSKCYQENDPTSQTLFSLLPTDGGVINIQGCGAIYKLFALRFGLLVFAANGVWFISGSSGIGFTATDFSVTKISSIKTVSGTSFIDVQGFPMFWNQEGIYQVTPSTQPGSAHSPDIQLDVQNLTLGTILTYYGDIPFVSKSYARGDYDYVNYIIQWCFRSTAESGITNRYQYDTILNYNVVTKAFYPYTLPSSLSTSQISDIKYIDYPGGSNNGLNPSLKYITSTFGGNVTFSEENNFSTYVDFFNDNNVGFNFNSYFNTGYTLPGQGLRKMQIPYLYIFSRNPGFNAYAVRAIWDYAGSGTLGVVNANSGKWSTRQLIENNIGNRQMVYNKIRLRGRGLAVQIRVESVGGNPFDIMGWSVWNEVNQNI